MTKHSKTREPQSADTAVGDLPPLPDLPSTGPAPAHKPPALRKPRENTKQAALIAMLRSDTGATIPEIMQATGWLSHTVRGALAGALKKRGLIVTSELVEGRGRVYHLPQA